MADDPRDAGECRRRALRLLGRRTHFTAELRLKLLQRDFAEETVDEVLEGLADQGLIDDHAAGIEFVETRLRRKPMGPIRFQAELARRGLDRSSVAGVLAAAYPADEEQVARRVLASGSRGDRAKIARRLERLGFRSTVIGRLVHEIREPGKR